MSRRIVTTAMLIVAMASIVAWHAGARSRAPQFAILFDRSQSNTAACAGVEAVVSRVASAARYGSSLVLLGTGDSSVASEPRWIWSGNVPTDNRVFEARERRNEGRRHFVEEVVGRCQHVISTLASPIFQGVKRALEHLKTRGCGRNLPGCTVFVNTDGAENVEPHFKKALSTRSGSIVIPQPLVNDGIRVVFCGVAETNPATAGRHGATSNAGRPEYADRLQGVWTAAFSDHELVTFEPFCRAYAG